MSLTRRDFLTRGLAATTALGASSLATTPGLADTPRADGPFTLNYAPHFGGGIIGMEHGKSRPGREGEVALITAYRQVDPHATSN